MGIVSSIFVHVVISVCWQCRLYIEGDTSGQKLEVSSPGSGFLNTPDATSTPQSPGGDAKDAVTETRSKSPTKEKRSHRLSEILSPVEQEMIRVTMARGYGTPAPFRSRGGPSRLVVLRNVRRPPSRDPIHPDLLAKRFPVVSSQHVSPVGIYRTRGIRI